MLSNLEKYGKVILTVSIVLILILLVYIAYILSSTGATNYAVSSNESIASDSVSPESTASTLDLGDGNVITEPSPKEWGTVRPTEEPLRSLNKSITPNPSPLDSKDALDYGNYSKFTGSNIDNYVSSLDYVSDQASSIRIPRDWSGVEGTPKRENCGVYESGNYFFCDTATGYRLIFKDAEKVPMVAVVAIGSSEVPKEIYQRLTLEDGGTFVHYLVKVGDSYRDSWVSPDQIK